MKGIKAHTCFVFLFLWGSLCFAQDKISLKKAIDEIEQQHGYTFNYAEETISGYTVTQIDPSLSFAEKITQLKSQTKLLFTLLGNKLVTISLPESNLVCGNVKDEETGLPIAFATVQAAKKAVVTDENGYFSIDAPPTENIKIRFLGYRTAEITINNLETENCNPIFLSPLREQLDAVLLSSYLVQGMSKMSNGAERIDFNNFTALPGLIETDVLQSVQSLPGVHSTNETVSNINIRGGTNDQNLVLWDGIKMYQTGHFFGLISAFNPQITEQVSIQKNGTSATLTDGVSGTIAMETEKEVSNTFSGSLGASLIDANVFLDIPLGKTSSLQIGGRKSLSDVVTTPTYDAYFTRIAQDTEVETNVETVRNTNRSFDFYDVSLRWLYQIGERDKIRVNFLYVDNILAFNENATINNTAFSRESSVAQNSLGAGALWQHQWGEHLNTTLHVYESDYTLRAINANILDQQRFLQENSVSETGIKTAGILSLKETQKLTFGYELIETKVTNLDDVDVPLVRTLVAEVVRTHSGFGEYSIRFNDYKSILIAGLRYNYLDKFNESIIEPRLQFSQKFLEHFSLQVAGEFKHQITSQVINFQNDFLGIEKRRWQLSNNSTIPIIKSKQASLGFNYSNKGWLLSIEGYYKFVDGITSQEQGFQNQFEFVKTSGSYEVLGADVLFRKRFRDISLWISYSFMDNAYSFESLSETAFPSNYDIPHSVTFGSTYVYDTLKITGGFNWRSGNPTTSPVEGNEVVGGAINFDPPNSERFEDYIRVDASALYEVSLVNAMFEAGISVWNILDQTNTISTFYRVNENGDIVENKQTSLGFTPNAVLRVIL
ncbi:TonB-dependent receptor [Marinirhabdus gelatinilytica]|uniref:Outer membrane receptor for ferrienterochelin and colicin n=1 Tax=Marinirhabdus gelatinilytica TaxID=1703343 RepID=A0A370QIX9_9FLAO|nr:carboxypeptidase-like regulatory domain-containing protein [Marinirhabdus gelatinilytica]RDK88324.1 outer membrane receptor for ferrienterochelin and colicin [Marinirhabdus gelatinilytica]